MPVVIACPTCQQKVRIGENLLGKQVKCPQCKNPFIAVDPNAVPPPATSWEGITPKSEFAFDAPAPLPTTVEPSREDFDDEKAPARPSERPRKSGGSTFVDYLLFRRMVTPGVIIVLFYVGVVALIIGGIIQAVSGVLVLIHGSIWGILALLGALFGTILAILLLRIYCEVVAVFFRILDNVRAINEKLDAGVKTQG